VETAWSHFIGTIWQILSESAFWVLVSLLIGGLVHEFLPTSRFRERLNAQGRGAMFGAVLFGALLPICSCGVIPLAISLYRAGVRIGPVMAFAAATPIINPAAVILSLALLGPQITAAYVVLGLTLPFLLGIVAERWGDRPSPMAIPAVAACCAPTTGCCDSAEEAVPPSPRFWRRVGSGLQWGLTDLGPTIAFYMSIGVLLAGVIAAFLPPSWTETYLRESSFIALAAAGLLGASIYVCAVAHIPLVATLLAAGAAPGVSIVFLVTGTATNLPELIALYKTIGRRTVTLYAVSLIAGAMLAGTLVNAWLMPGFEPAFDPIDSLELLEAGERLQPTVGAVATQVTSIALVGLMLLGTWRRAAAWLRARRAGGRDEGCCSG
jgi:uncharacterized membrane protein YraQ (UPF0718 family)